MRERITHKRCCCFLHIYRNNLGIDFYIALAKHKKKCGISTHFYWARETNIGKYCNGTDQPTFCNSVAFVEESGTQIWLWFCVYIQCVCPLCVCVFNRECIWLESVELKAIFGLIFHIDKQSIRKLIWTMRCLWHLALDSMDFGGPFQSTEIGRAQSSITIKWQWLQLQQQRWGTNNSE